MLLFLLWGCCWQPSGAKQWNKINQNKAANTGWNQSFWTPSVLCVCVKWNNHYTLYESNNTNVGLTHWDTRANTQQCSSSFLEGSLCQQLSVLHPTFGSSESLSLIQELILRFVLDDTSFQRRKQGRVNKKCIITRHEKEVSKRFLFHSELV